MFRFNDATPALGCSFRHLIEDDDITHIAVDDMANGTYQVTADNGCYEMYPGEGAAYMPVGPAFATEEEAMAYAIAFYHTVKGGT